MLDTLTGREREIADLVAQGLSNKEICRRLGRMEGTIKIHLHNIYDKTGIKNRTALARAWLTGTLTPPPLSGLPQSVPTQ